jgi:hypothetical protein
MVINREKYRASNNNQGYKIVTSESTERAVTIATAIIRHFYKDTTTAQRSYRSGDQCDPGELVSHQELLSCLRPFVSLTT